MSLVKKQLKSAPLWCGFFFIGTDGRRNNKLFTLSFSTLIMKAFIADNNLLIGTFRNLKRFRWPSKHHLRLRRTRANEKDKTSEKITNTEWSASVEHRQSVLTITGQLSAESGAKDAWMKNIADFRVRKIRARLYWVSLTIVGASTFLVSYFSSNCLGKKAKWRFIIITSCSRGR